MSGFIYSNPTEADQMKKADLTNQVTGSTAVFTVPEIYETGSLRVYYNGVRQIEDTTFSETTSTTFTLTFTPVLGDYISIDYKPN